MGTEFNRWWAVAQTKNLFGKLNEQLYEPLGPLVLVRNCLARSDIGC